MIDFSELSTELFQVLRTYGRDIVLYDENGQRVFEPADARRFYVTTDNILVSINKAGDDSAIRVYLSDTIVLSSIQPFLDTLRNMATSSNLLFHVKKFSREIKPQDFATRASLEEDQEKENMNQNIMEGLYGTSRSSYLKLENARMIVRHNARINEQQIGSRGRYIQSIFIENAAGERVLFPTNILSGARAMTQHVNQGGSFTDAISQQIQRMAADFKNLAQVANFLDQTNAAHKVADGIPASHSIQASGIREHKDVQKTWSKTFKNKAAMEAWCQANNAIVTEQSDISGLDPITESFAQDVMKTMHGLRRQFARIGDASTYMAEAEVLTNASALMEDQVADLTESIEQYKEFLNFGESRPHNFDESVFESIARLVEGNYFSASTDRAPTSVINTGGGNPLPASTPQNKDKSQAPTAGDAKSPQQDDEDDQEDDDNNHQQSSGNGYTNSASNNESQEFDGNPTIREFQEWLEGFEPDVFLNVQEGKSYKRNDDDDDDDDDDDPDPTSRKKKEDKKKRDDRETKRSRTDEGMFAEPKSGKLAMSYGYGAQRYDAGRSVTVLGDDGDDYIVQSFPIGYPHPTMKMRKDTITLDAPIEETVDGREKNRSRTDESLVSVIKVPADKITMAYVEEHEDDLYDLVDACLDEIYMDPDSGDRYVSYIQKAFDMIDKFFPGHVQNYKNEASPRHQEALETIGMLDESLSETTVDKIGALGWYIIDTKGHPNGPFPSEQRALDCRMNAQERVVHGRLNDMGKFIAQPVVEGKSFKRNGDDSDDVVAKRKEDKQKRDEKKNRPVNEDIHFDTDDQCIAFFDEFDNIRGDHVWGLTHDGSEHIEHLQEIFPNLDFSAVTEENLDAHNMDMGDVIERAIAEVEKNGSGGLIDIIHDHEGPVYVFSSNGKFYAFFDHTAEGEFIEQLNVQSEDELIAAIAKADAAADEADEDYDDEEDDDDDDVDESADSQLNEFGPSGKPMSELKAELADAKAKFAKMNAFDSAYGSTKNKIERLEKEVKASAAYGKDVEEGIMDIFKKKKPKGDGYEHLSDREWQEMYRKRAGHYSRDGRLDPNYRDEYMKNEGTLDEAKTRAVYYTDNGNDYEVLNVVKIDESKVGMVKNSGGNWHGPVSIQEVASIYEDIAGSINLDDYRTGLRRAIKELRAIPAFSPNFDVELNELQDLAYQITPDSIVSESIHVGSSTYNQAARIARSNITPDAEEKRAAKRLKQKADEAKIKAELKKKGIEEGFGDLMEFGPSTIEIKYELQAAKAKIGKLSPFDPEYRMLKNKIEDLEAALKKNSAYGKGVEESVDTGFDSEQYWDQTSKQMGYVVESLQEGKIARGADGKVQGVWHTETGWLTVSPLVGEIVKEGLQLDEFQHNTKSIHELKSELLLLKSRFSKMTAFDPNYAQVKNEIIDLQNKIKAEATYGKSDDGVEESAKVQVSEAVAEDFSTMNEGGPADVSSFETTVDIHRDGGVERSLEVKVSYYYQSQDDDSGMVSPNTFDGLAGIQIVSVTALDNGEDVWPILDPLEQERIKEFCLDDHEENEQTAAMEADCIGGEEKDTEIGTIIPRDMGKSLKKEVLAHPSDLKRQNAYESAADALRDRILQLSGVKK